MTQQANTPYPVKPHTEMILLPSDFQPGPMDVICSRGRTAYDHNKYFRELIQNNLEIYSQASTKANKSLVVSDVVETIREGSPNGGFVRCVDGVWYQVSEGIAREKCGGSFRHILLAQSKADSNMKKRSFPDVEETDGVTSVDNAIITESYNTNKRPRVESTTPTVLPFSPENNKAMYMFGDLLKDIASRREELTKKPILEAKKPKLPPPDKFPCAPEIIAVQHSCSIESSLTLDMDALDELFEYDLDQQMDEFDLGLSRFTSVASAGSLFPIL